MKWSLVKGKGRPDAYRDAANVRVPSVTTITGARKTGVEALLIWANRLGREGKDHKEVRDLAASAGSLAHAMVENSIHGLDPMDSVPEVSAEIQALARKGYDAFIEWQTVMDVVYLATEIPMVNEEYHYGGTPDAIGRMKDGKVALLDWKTSGGVYGDYIIQMAAYKYLWDALNPDKKIEACYLLRFGKEHGDFHFHSYPSEVIAMGWRAFLHLRELYQLDKELKKVVG